jgi:hypothetical protein
MNRKIAWLCIAALAIGCAVAWWANRGPVVPTIEMNRTDRLAEEIKGALETATARIASQDTKVRTEVRYVYEQVRTRINALPADSVADGLNAELSLFRRMEAGTGGLDGD